jgi:NADH-quinone oxidoreductase subunit H
MLEDLLIATIKVTIIFMFCPLWVPIMVWAERRVSALIQNRLGPNRANIAGFKMFGIVQLAADMIKFMMKEDFAPGSASRFYHTIAPLFLLIPALLTFLIIPFGDVIRIGEKTISLQGADLNIGILYLLAIASFGVYAPVIAGWASNNKYALLGGLRAAAQMISYEISMGLLIISIVMTYNSVRLNEIIIGQGEVISLFGNLITIPRWGVINQPLAFFLFLLVAFAEVNRTPFDLPEAESELVSGYHTEYSGMKFALFMMSEYMSMLTMAALIVCLFFGGWQVPWFPTASLFEHAESLLRIVLAVAGIGGILAGILMHHLNRGARYYYGVNRNSPWVKAKVVIQYAVAFGSLLIGLWMLLSAMHLFPSNRLIGVLVLDGALPAWVRQLVVTLTQITMFLMKLTFFMFLYLWVRWTIPRFRYDQLMRLGWLVVLPLALANIFITAFFIVFWP